MSFMGRYKDSEGYDLVSRNIKREIDDKVRYLTSNPKYYLDMNSLTKGKNHREATKHSVSIELVNYNMTRSECLRTKRKEQKRCEKCLSEGRKWAFNNYNESFDESYIRNLGMIVDPISNSSGFRNSNVKISGSRISPPSYEKVPRDLSLFLLQNNSIENILEKAIHAHFNIAKIHPFSDGNGRTSRLVQDAILHSINLPLPIITLAERGEYIEKIEEASYEYHSTEARLEDRHRRILRKLRDDFGENSIPFEEKKDMSKSLISATFGPEQHRFFDFIAFNVLDSLSMEIKKLYPTDNEMRKFLKKNKKKR